MALSGFIKAANLLIDTNLKKQAGLDKMAFLERFTRLNRGLKGLAKTLSDNADLTAETGTSAKRLNLADLGTMLARGDADTQLMDSVLAAKGAGKAGTGFINDMNKLNDLRAKLQEGAKTGGINYQQMAEEYQTLAGQLFKKHNLDRRMSSAFDTEFNRGMEGIRSTATPNMGSMVYSKPDKSGWLSNMSPETKSKLGWGLVGAGAVGIPIGVSKMVAKPVDPYQY